MATFLSCFVKTGRFKSLFWFVVILLPLITVVNSGRAQQAGQLAHRLSVVLNEFSQGTELQLTFLKQELSFPCIFYEMRDKTRWKANDQGATFGFFRMWTHKICSQNIVCQE